MYMYLYSYAKYNTLLLAQEHVGIYTVYMYNEIYLHVCIVSSTACVAIYMYLDTCMISTTGLFCVVNRVYLIGR